MDKQKIRKNTELQTSRPAPQFHVRSGILIGASVQSCLQDLYYWQNQYYQNCGGPKPVPYTS